MIPAFDEEKSIDKVVNGLPMDIVTETVVVNNNSTDNTALVAQNAGATVLNETQQGYGAACLNGIAYVNKQAKNKASAILVFIDGDYSDYPEQLPAVIEPILNDKADMVIGSRRKGKAEKGSLMPQQVFGNWLAPTLIRLIYNYKYTELGPSRAINSAKLNDLNMPDTKYGWTVAM